jgi:5S rRNA maturation endonuclease (ribonuclease M5)
MSNFDFRSLSPKVFVEYLGEPTKKTSTHWRWRSKGSFAVNLKKAEWYDFENRDGGGVFKFLMQHNPDRKISDVLEQDYGVPKLSQSTLSIFNYNKGAVHRLDFPDHKQIWQTGDTEAIKHIPYRLDEWVDADSVVIVEGEKCVNALFELGILATCNVGGAGKWSEHLNQYFEGKDVVILPDNDEAGERHALLVRSKLLKHAKSVKCIKLPDLQKRGDIVDWLINPDNTKEKLEQILSSPENMDFGFKLYSVDDLAKLPKQEWLIHNLLPKVGVGTIYGAPASFKSFVALHMALCVSSGRPVADLEVKAGRCLYLPLEGVSGLYKRIKASVLHHQFDASNIRISFEDLSFTNGEVIDHLKSSGHKFDLIIIDPMVKSMIGLDENSNSEIASALKLADDLAKNLECCVLFIDHSGKDAKGARGASAKLANQDFVIHLKRNKETDEISLSIDKQKDAPDNFEIRFKSKEVTIQIDDEDVSTLVIEELTDANEKISNPDLIQKLLKQHGDLTKDDLKKLAADYYEERDIGRFNVQSFNDAISRGLRDSRLNQNGDKISLNSESC